MNILGLLDPGNIFGGTKGKSADQKALSLLSGGLSNVIDADHPLNRMGENSGLLGQSANAKNDFLNTLGTTPAPVLGSPMQIQPAEQKYSSPVNKSIWSMYNPKGSY